jgi:3',5'-cyclic AMP phosphodiesterase CpdA
VRVIPLGQHPAASHVIAHVSDTHLLAGGAPLYGAANTIASLEQAMAQLERLDPAPEAIVFTGDLADLGEPDAYERLRAIVVPSAERMGAEIVWVMGNHDEREPYASILFGEEPTDAPQDRVHLIGGLRIISLDTTVRGYHHGDLDDAQLHWLASVLAEPAPEGTLIAVHHPPIPSPLLPAMDMLELRGQSRLEAVVRGTDVRGILGGHLHYTTHSTFAGVPVSVAAATCYTMALATGARLLSGVDANQAVNLVHVYSDRIVHTTVPLGDAVEITAFPIEAIPQIEAMTPQERDDAFSRKVPTLRIPGM